MADQPIIILHPRATVGSGTARRLRRRGEAPAVVYAHGDPLPVAVNAVEFAHAVPSEQFGSKMVRLVLDDRDLGPALVKSVQVNTLTRQILNIEFQRVTMEDDLLVSIPVILTGDHADHRRGGVLDQAAHAIMLKCRASEVPAQLSYDISSLRIGDAVRAGQLALPPQCELITGDEEIIATIAPPTVPAGEEVMTIPEGVTGPELTGDKQKDDSQLATE